MVKDREYRHTYAVTSAIDRVTKVYSADWDEITDSGILKLGFNGQPRKSILINMRNVLSVVIDER